VPDIEFFPEEPGDSTAEEVLDAGARRRVPQWAGIAVLAVAAVVVAVVVALQRGDPSGTPAGAALSGSPPGTPFAAVPSIVPSIPSDLGTLLSIGAPGPVLDVAVAAGTTWVLQPGLLHGIDSHGRISTVTIPGRPLRFPDGTFVRVLPDPAANAVWVVVQEPEHGRVLQFRADNLQVVHDTEPLPIMVAAATLDGHLYFGAGNRVYQLRGTSPHVLARLPQPLGALAADPTRHRLLLATLGDPTALSTLAPSGHHPVLRRLAAVRVAKPTLVVTAGRIWLAGYDTGAGILMRLSPTTLRPVQHSTLDPVLEPGAAVVAGGVAVIWVRDGGSASAELRCVDARSGQQVQSWPLSGGVGSAHGYAVLGSQGGPVRLRLRGCRG
jgi:hypothetical protein